MCAALRCCCYCCRSSLDFWHVFHRIDDASPLWPIRHSLKEHLRAVDVSLSARAERRSHAPHAQPHCCVRWTTELAAHGRVRACVRACVRARAAGAYDTAFNQPVKLFVHYRKEEVLHDAKFEPMESTSDDGQLVTVDHAKLDLFTREHAVERARRGSKAGHGLGVSALLHLVENSRSLVAHRRSSKNVFRDLESARSGCRRPEPHAHASAQIPECGQRACTARTGRR